MDARISRLLDDMISDDDYSAKELARGAGCHRSHIGKVAAGETMLSASKLIRLSHWLEEKEADTRLAEVFNTDEFMVVERSGGEANGKVADDVADHAMHMGLFLEHMQKNEIDKAIYHLRQCDKEHDDLWSEVAQKIGETKVKRNGH